MILKWFNLHEIICLYTINLCRINYLIIYILILQIMYLTTIISFRKGISQSALPYRRSVPTWLKLTPEDCKELIYKLAKKGHTPSQIGNFNNAFIFLQIYISLVFNSLRGIRICNVNKHYKANYSGDLKIFNLISSTKHVCKKISGVWCEYGICHFTIGHHWHL